MEPLRAMRLEGMTETMLAGGASLFQGLVDDWGHLDDRDSCVDVDADVVAASVLAAIVETGDTLLETLCARKNES
jgi:hypothetical protein